MRRMRRGVLPGVALLGLAATGLGGAPRFSETKLDAAAATYRGNFGSAVALDGDTLAVGAYQSGERAAGTVVVFERGEHGGWSASSTLAPSGLAAGTRFGASVALSGDHLAASGARSADVWLFERRSGGWREVAKPALRGLGGDGAGGAVALDGDTLVVGARGDGPPERRGAALVLQRVRGGRWTQVRKLAAADGAVDDQFGFAVAVHGDAIAVGAHFERDVSFAPDDHHERLETETPGAAYVFERDRGGEDRWGQAAKLVADDRHTGAHFGTAVALGGDTLVVGSPGARGYKRPGAVYLFAREPGESGGWRQVAKLVASDAHAGNKFGGSVAVRGDTLAVGAWGDATAGPGAGAVYLFERAGEPAHAWREVAKLVASDARPVVRKGYARWRGPIAGDHLGWSVALGANGVAAGAPCDGPTGRCGRAPGSAYVFSRER